jgi:type II secretory pathway component PulF
MEIAIEIVSLLTGLVGLISAGVTAYFAIKTFIKSLKDKKSTEIWNLIMTIADAAMKEAEASQLSGEGKKRLVMDTVKAGLDAAGLDIADFIDQLSKYIDETIAFTKEMQKAKELKELNK